MVLRFLTSTPLDVRRGSGTYVGISVLARALEARGHTVAIEAPKHSLPIHTAQRILYNLMLRRIEGFDLTVGFDMDGYRIAAGGGHVASLKGVIADEVRFESGMTRRTMAMQAAREKVHVHRADMVIVTSRYSGDRAQEFYELGTAPVVVPELIDLAEWRRLLPEQSPQSHRFTVLYAGRLYRRKRVDVLVEAAESLRWLVRGLEVRIVGDGPCAADLQRLSQERKLQDTVTWLGHVSRAQLAAEYKRCDVFCLPSVQEGFGIVLLEAMAAGKPIVAARAAAIPEVAPHAELVNAGDAHALCDALEGLYRSAERRQAMIAAGTAWVEQFDAPRVAGLFLDAVAPICK